jgi:hypothetical protein
MSGTPVTGDTLNVLFTGGTFVTPILVSAASTAGNTATQQATSLKNAINANTVLAAASITATGTSTVVVAIPAAEEPIVLSVFPNIVNPTLATVAASSVIAGDTAAITITNANIAGGAQTVTYTAGALDTAATIATGLFNLINADELLVNAGISATNGTPDVVSIAWPAAIGSITFSEAVTGTGNETITLSTAATEVMTLSTAASETVTLGNSGKFAGGTGPVIPGANAELTFGGSIIQLWYGRPRILDYTLLSALVAQGINVV